MKVIEMKNGGRVDPDFDRLRCVLACVGKDRVRPELQRVLIEKARGGVHVVGCDGKRLRRDLFKLKAEPGLYEVEINNSREIRLVASRILVRYPDYRKVIPKCDNRDVYVVSGKGSWFVMWVGASLGCYVDPRLVALADDERVDVMVQKVGGGTSPLLVQSDQLLLVIMPIKLDDGVAKKLDSYQLDRLRKMRKVSVVKPKPRAEAAPWWSLLAKRKAA